MYFGNPQIKTYSQNEFANPQGAEGAPILNELSIESYKAPSERRRNVVGFEYDADLSDRRHAVYHHRATKRVVMANRGTVPSKLCDLYTDAALTVGTFKGTKHYKNAVRKYQEVQNKYGKGQNYHLTGHSLGGMTTVALHHRFPHSTSSSTAWNPPGSIPGVFSSGIQKLGYKTRTQKKVQANHQSFVNTLDPVSILSRHRKGLKNQKKFSLNPHSLTQWQGF
ncbi:unnamed protein product [Ectocarpus sp. 12 AP-2014]